MLENSANIQPTSEQILKQIEELVNAWCERRCLKALRIVLQAWPMSSVLTDDWGTLLEALGNVRAFASNELTEQETKKLADTIVQITKIVYRTS